jgi:hypothetical protein
MLKKNPSEKRKFWLWKSLQEMAIQDGPWKLT